jgi:hypothetical protein
MQSEVVVKQPDKKSHEPVDVGLRIERILVFVAMAGVATAEQLQRVLPERPHITKVRHWTRVLSAKGPHGEPLLEMRQATQGRKVFNVFRLTPAGIRAAQRIVSWLAPFIGKMPAPSHVAHAIMVADILVGILEALGPWRPAELPFTWATDLTEEVRTKPIPLGENVSYVTPDAVLVFPTQKRRFLLELETGSHALVSGTMDDPRTINGKAWRHARLHMIPKDDGPQRTRASRHFRDDFENKSFVVVPTQAMVDAVKLAGSKSEYVLNVTSTQVIAANNVVAHIGQAVGLGTMNEDHEILPVRRHDLRRLVRMCEQAVAAIHANHGKACPPMPAFIGKRLRFLTAFAAYVDNVGSEYPKGTQVKT